MKKKKSDFPEITYKFVKKSNYSGGYGEKKHIFPKIIITILIVFALVYLGSYFLSKKYGDDFLFAFINDMTNRENKDKPDKDIPEVENNGNSEKEPEAPPQEPPEAPENKENNENIPESNPIEEKPAIDPKERIELQIAIFNSPDEEEKTRLISEYEEKTGESFKDSYLFPSDKEKIPEDLIKTFTREEASLVRNEIYARRGYKYQGKLNRFFSMKNWYKPVSQGLNLEGIEFENMNAIYTYELSKGWK